MLNNERAQRNGHAPMIFNPAAFKSKRRSLGWTQKRAADWFELSAPAIGHWETGKSVPWEKNWLKIMEFMELGDELQISLQMADQLTYDNAFVYFQPGSGKVDVKGPQNMVKKAITQLDEIIELAE